MQWWCAAQGIPWSWTWRPYPGVWLLLGLIGIGYWMVALRAPGVANDGGAIPDDGHGQRTISFFAGVAVLWIALDWPVGALGSGYLASVHMVQFLMISLIAPPLFLYGLPEPALRSLDESRFGPPLRLLTHPLVALVGYNFIVAATHWPAVVDGLMVTQWGSFAIDMAWLLGGLLLWWPVVCTVPERRFPYPLKIGYLLLNTVLNTAPYAFLTFGERPFYATYELAPPVGLLSSGEDQRIAGLIMKLGGGVILWVAIGTLFFRWWRVEEAKEPALP